MTCDGPMVWFTVEPDEAILECACGEVFIGSGTFLPVSHADTALMREGSAA